MSGYSTCWLALGRTLRLSTGSKYLSSELMRGLFPLFALFLALTARAQMNTDTAAPFQNADSL